MSYTFCTYWLELTLNYIACLTSTSDWDSSQPSPSLFSWSGTGVKFLSYFRKKGRACFRRPWIVHIDAGRKIKESIFFEKIWHSVYFSLLAVAIRFGNAFLEDVLVMEITLRWNNSAEFLSFYSLFNCYLFTLAFVYSPSKTAMWVCDWTLFVCYWTAMKSNCPRP